MSLFENDDEVREDELVLGSDLILLFSQINAFFNQGMQQQLADSPISADGLWFLSTVMMLGDNATPSELAHWMVRKPNTISGLTKRLEEKGFVEKNKSIGANNKVYLKIALTEQGKQFLKKRSGTPLVSAAFSSLSLEEKKQFRKTLFTIRASIAQQVKGYDEPPFPSPERPSPYLKRLG